MSTPLICYILVGSPGCGKSTLAAKMVEHNPDYRIVSTDEIRAELYGDASIQGSWLEISAQVLCRIHEAIASGNPIIYDATNFKRPWRIDLLGKLVKYKNVYWVALHVQTPLECCILWNQQRQRQVPEIIIETMAQYLDKFPPVEAEGFAKVYSLTPTEIDLQKIFCIGTGILAKHELKEVFKVLPQAESLEYPVAVGIY